MTVTTFVFFVLLFGFVNTHQRVARQLKGGSEAYHSALIWSTFLGTVFGVVFLVWYAFQVEWYWALLLFGAGSIVAGLSFGLLDHVFGARRIASLGFVAWPVLGFFLIKSVPG